MTVRKIGIVGLGQAGKTTLFRILTHASSSGAATGRGGTSVATLRVPDLRLDRLEQVSRRGKVVHAGLEYFDTPGSVIDLARAGAHAVILRETDALAHVVRGFESSFLPVTGGGAEPKRDVESVELELILSDLAVIEKRLERLEKDLKKQKSPALEREHQFLQDAKTALENQTPLREVAWTPEQERALRGFAFLSAKPMLYVLNVGEKDAPRAHQAETLAAELGLSQRPKTAAAAVCGKVEAELAELSDAEAGEFLQSYGLRESAIARLVRSSYGLLGLISFFTIGESECRAWTIPVGTTALEAAGEVHSDFQKGFIRAEVIGFEDLMAVGSLAHARQHGLLRIVGKEYILQDGEVVYFRHSP